MDPSWLRKRFHDGLHYRLRTFAGGRLAAHCLPCSIIFLLTERCNARCVHCDIWKNKGKEDSPTQEQWQTVLGDLRRWLGRMQVAFSGGEALLRPYTVDLVRYSRSIGLFPEVLTHGWWEDQSRIEQLALADPWRITVSLDGLGKTHDLVRGREGFFEKTSRSLDTLKRVRKDGKLRYSVCLKTVIMEHNLETVPDMALFARDNGFDIFYQPIEQNYNTLEDALWYEHSENWPKDARKVTEIIGRLIEMKRQGLPILNSMDQLETMIAYFGNPAASRISVQAHTAHERRRVCSALTTLQFQANGDVTVCSGLAPVGNVKQAPIRQIWERRPRVWESGCCLEHRLTDAERRALPVVS